MKYITYVGLFTLLGLLVSLLLHAVVELAIINLLVNDFAAYNLGLSWAQWFAVHRWGSILLTLAGIGIGFWQGLYWWQRLYGVATTE